MRKFFLVFVCLLFSAFLFAEDTVYYQSPFSANNPQIMGQGGSVTANGTGYNTLFGNPANFTKAEADFNLLSLSVWTRLGIMDFINDYDTATNSDIFGGLVNVPTEAQTGDVISAVLDQVTGTNDLGVPANGLGLGLSLGMGWVGNSLALAGVLNVDSNIWGQTIPSAEVWADLAFVLGIGIPIYIGETKLMIGADVRPMVRAYAQPDASLVLSVLSSTGSGNDLMSLFGSAETLYGTALGIDLGVNYQMGPLVLGFSMRDAGNTALAYESYTLQELATKLQNNPNYQGSLVSDAEYLMPMTTKAGVSFEPDLGDFEGVFDFSVHAELEDPIGIDPSPENYSFWSRLNGGANIRLFSLVDLWAGINGGNLTVGTELNVWGFRLGAAIYTEEFGNYAGEWPVTGMSIEAAFRF